MKRRLCFFQLIEAPFSVSAGHDEARSTEVRQMARGSRLRNIEDVHQIPDAQFALREQMQNAQPCAVGESSKHQINLRFRHGSVYSLTRLQWAEKS